MADLTAFPTSLMGRINATIESQQDSKGRRHLGGSLIGRPCARQLWYDFRWVKETRHKGKLLRLFERGHLEEFRFEKWLLDAGVSFTAKDSTTGKQYRVVAVRGHFGGSLDGIGSNVPEAPKTEHLFEFKTHNDKSFKKLVKEGVRTSKPEHFVQQQIYMHLRHLTRSVYMAINKNDDDMYIERVRYDKSFAETILMKAQTIIDSPTPCEGISYDQTHFTCRWCDYRSLCAGLEKAETNCRTCAHVVVADGGRWHCNNYNCLVDPDPTTKDPETGRYIKPDGTIDPENDRNGCLHHELIPALNVEC